ncbi:hypothetical protein GCM10029978_103820 [Actinoallomurus acanthiterrae]
MSEPKGYKVFYADLVTASKEFAAQGRAYKALMPEAGPACPQGGDNVIDKMLGVTLQALGEMHTVLAEAMSSHSWKLQNVHDKYLEVEAKTTTELGIMTDLVNSQAPVN